jgi:hypothetical protein
MTEIFSPLRTTALMSARTAKYIEAMIREGDDFDYDTWLKRVREEEAEAKQLSATSVLDQQLVSAQLGLQLGATHDQHVWPRRTPAYIAKPVRVARAIGGTIQDLRGKAPKPRLRRWLETIQVTWQDIQASRARDALYDYLRAVFAIVMHFKVRRRTKRLLRHAFEFADLSFDKRADPFTAVIRCTSGGAANNKMISKWARALRYVARRKPVEMRLKAFMKDAGGVNACADRYAKHKRHQRHGR